jgi:endogenous inhibitor of DNA gyrase (YacG/DUF329 family)
MTTTGETPAEIIARIKAENQKCKVCGKKAGKKYGKLKTYCSKECQKIGQTKFKK